MVHHRSILEALLKRGHYVRFTYDKKWTILRELEELKEYFQGEPNFKCGPDINRSDKWRNLLFYAREFRSYWRYLRVKGQSSFYRNRWKGYLPKTAQSILSHKIAEKIFSTRLVGTLMAAIERVVPPDKRITADIRSFAPDVILASQTNTRFSPADLEYLKAGKALGIPSLISVATWDNLTTKGLFHIWPDRLLVWNHDHVREAENFQFFPKERVRIIGSPFFDGWFDGNKSPRNRGEFCKTHGLNPDDKYILYLGSSRNIAADETWLIDDLRRLLDEADDARLRRLKIVVRPHPHNYKIYEHLNNQEITVIPKKSSLPSNNEAFQLFLETMSYAEVFVGINTSSMLDGVILGKPGIALMVDKYNKTQRESVYFKDLMKANILDHVQGSAECVNAIKRILDGQDNHRSDREAFIRKYIRPRGLEKSAGEFAVDEIEDLFVSKGNV